MPNRISLQEAAELLLQQNDILILTHAYPDGDTLGSGFALCGALHNAGKRARVACPDVIPARFDYMTKPVRRNQFDEQFIVAVDIADPKLMGRFEAQYGGKVDLSIDHHPSNLLFAARNYVQGEAAATCEIIYELIGYMNLPLDNNIVSALYTGISTDTGCFRYANVTADTHRIVAELMAFEVDFAEINRVMFETKSRARVEIERAAMTDMEFFNKDLCAMITVSKALCDRSGASDDELEGITSLPRKIEGVLLGITLRERGENFYKVSMRSYDPVNAAALCAIFGGGGHARAAGCQIQGTLDEVKAKIRQTATEQVNCALAAAARE